MGMASSAVPIEKTPVSMSMSTILKGAEGEEKDGQTAGGSR
ncbi:MAG: hypothetical protein ABIG67_06150 [Pseudomonadota bacterium]